MKRYWWAESNGVRPNPRSEHSAPNEFAMQVGDSLLVLTRDDARILASVLYAFANEQTGGQTAQ